MALVNLISVVCVSVGISACSLLGVKTQPDQLAEDQVELVTRDFVSAISKLQGFSPRQTTVQFYKPSTVFLDNLHDKMRDAGYGIQIISKGENSAKRVSYFFEHFETSEGTTVAYDVRVGDVKLSREYEIRAGRIFPIAALSILGGVTDGNSTVDNSIFRQSDTHGWTVVRPTTGAAIRGKNDTAKNSTNLLGDFASSQHTAVPTKRNIADIGQSNYSSLFKLYEPMRSETLVFPNDSLVLGAKNKSTIYSVAQQFDTTTQVISVVGCSTGKTKIDNGNALLANGRANRVKEELIIAGVSPDSILDEGCWAGSRVDDIPGRGVILTLRTKISQG